MKTASKLVLATATALTLGLAAIAVYAHPGGDGPGCASEFGGGPGARPMGMGPGMGHGFGPGMGMGRGPGLGNPAAVAEGRLAWLKAELKITAAQEAAWKTFADQQRQQAEARQALMKGVADKIPATAVERMELRNQWGKQRQEQGEKMTAAFKTLYAALTPEQKSVVDQGWSGGQHSRRGPGRSS